MKIRKIFILLEILLTFTLFSKIPIVKAQTYSGNIRAGDYLNYYYKNHNKND